MPIVASSAWSLQVWRLVICQHLQPLYHHVCPWLQALSCFTDNNMRIVFLDTPGYTEAYADGFRAVVESMFLKVEAALYVLDLTNLNNAQVQLV